MVLVIPLSCFSTLAFTTGSDDLRAKLDMTKSVVLFENGKILFDKIEDIVNRFEFYCS